MLFGIHPCTLINALNTAAFTQIGPIHNRPLLQCHNDPRTSLKACQSQRMLNVVISQTLNTLVNVHQSFSSEHLLNCAEPKWNQLRCTGRVLPCPETIAGRETMGEEDDDQQLEQDFSDLQVRKVPCAIEVGLCTRREVHTLQNQRRGFTQRFALGIVHPRVARLTCAHA